MSFSKLSDDTIIEIFSLLPLSSIARVRQVCKSWCILTTKVEGIIDHPFLLFNSSDHATLHALDVNYVGKSSSPLPSSVEKIDYPFVFEPLTDVFLHGPYRFDLLDSCNGLQCLRLSCERDCSINDEIILYNPSNNSFKILPREPAECSMRRKCGFKIRYIFSSDINRNDYKLYRIVQYSSGYPTLLPDEVKVYTLSTNSWRRINDDAIPRPTSEYVLRQHVYLNGVVHWISNMSSSLLKSSYKMDALDIEAEKYNVLDAPKKRVDDVEISLLCADVAVLRGCLCLCYRDGVVTELWMMKNYGVQDSWTKLFRTKNRTMQDPWKFKVIWLRKDGKVVMIEGSVGLILYDSEKDKHTDIYVPGNEYGQYTDPSMYMDNSIWLY